MRKSIRIMLGLSAIVAVVGCSSPRLIVTISPSGVVMESVSYDDKRIEKSDSVYDGPVQIDKDKLTRDVVVTAVTQSGVRVKETYTVTKGEPVEETLNIPAEVSVRVMPSDLKNVTVRIDGEGAEAIDGVYKRRFFTGERRTIEVVATDNERELVDKKKVTLQAGRNAECKLNLELTARFSADPNSITYGREIRFDASASSPNHSITSYIWDFGDGTNQKPRGNADVTHTYYHNPTVGKAKQLTVNLKVKVPNLESRPFSRTLLVDISDDKLVFKMEMFPRQTSLQPGDKVQLMLEPIDATFAKQARNLMLFFGDDQTIPGTEQGRAVTLECDDDSCKPIVVTHVYQTTGRFEPRLTYTRPELGSEERQRAVLTAADGLPTATIHVAWEYLSDDDLKERAWKDFYRQFKEVLQTSPDSRKALALTSLDNANFETKQPDFVQVVDKLTQMLVEDDDKYFVLEKKLQVLTRLAHEAVVDIRPELEKGVIDPASSSNEQVYRRYLDYGLATKHEGVEEPILYSIEIAGTEDRITALGGFAEHIGGEGTLEAPGQPIAKKQIAEDRSGGATWLRKLPILMARFRTADVLIAFKVLQQPSVETTTEPTSYNEVLEERMFTRTAFVKLHVRLLERSGRILRALDIAGKHSQEVTDSWLREQQGR